MAPAPSAPVTEADTVRLSGEALGTTWSVILPRTTIDPSVAQVAVEATLARVDRQMSTWRDDSELQRARRAKGHVQVSEGTLEVVQAAQRLASATEGAFDPTVQPLMELWGFYGTPRDTWPTDEELAAAQARIGWQRLQAGRSGDGFPILDVGGTAIDLSAIAKGHAVDRVVASLAGLGALDLLVEVGGEVRTHGRSPRGSAWTLGIDRPLANTAPGQDLVATVSVHNAALATSGNYRNRRRIGDQVVHHTLDPRTGRPSESDVLSASVLAPDCRSADGWATALMVLGSDRGLALLEEHEAIEAWLVVEVDGQMVGKGTPGFERQLASVKLSPE